jgi:prepilin-type N-terminal cleavage/methylation domain-containing protein
MKNNQQHLDHIVRAQTGFTLVEVMVAVGLFGLVVAGTIEIYIMCSRVWRVTVLSMDTSQMASLAVQRMVYGLESNCSLRSAGLITLQTNAYGHPQPFPAASKYWETGNEPPSAGNVTHYTHVNCAYGNDGSWRPDTNQTSAARAKRQLICNYVSAATITNTGGTVEITLTVEKSDGMFIASNQASMVVTKRNN